MGHYSKCSAHSQILLTNSLTSQSIHMSMYICIPLSFTEYCYYFVGREPCFLIMGKQNFHRSQFRRSFSGGSRTSLGYGKLRSRTWKHLGPKLKVAWSSPSDPSKSLLSSILAFASVYLHGSLPRSHPLDSWKDVSSRRGLG